MSISASDVNKLRQMTGAGMMDCKKALTEANGDFEAAIDILRKKGQKVSAARSDRETTEGSVFVKTTADNKEGVIVALGSETDFVAKNEEFQNLGNKIVEIAAQAKPVSIEALKNEKIDSRTIAEHITDLVGKIGEKIDIVAYHLLIGEKVVPYIHAGSKLGVLVALKGINGTDVSEVGKDVAMQIAAMKPVAVDKDGVAKDIVDREIQVGMEQARAEGKPENMLEKIAMGKLNKFYKEKTLLNQEFVKDSSKTIAQLLNGIHNGLTVSDFRRVSVS